MSSGAGERANELAQRSPQVKRALWSKQMSELCERMSKRRSKWPCTLRVDFIVILPNVPCTKTTFSASIHNSHQPMPESNYSCRCNNMDFEESCDDSNAKVHRLLSLTLLTTIYHFTLPHRPLTREDSSSINS